MITREELQSIQAGDVVAMKGNMHYEQEYTGTVCRVTKCHIVVNCCGSTGTKYQERYNRETGTRLGKSGWMMRTSIIYKKESAPMDKAELLDKILHDDVASEDALEVRKAAEKKAEAIRDASEELEHAASIFETMAIQARAVAARVRTSHDPQDIQFWFTSYAVGFLQNVRYDLIASAMRRM